MLLRLCAGLGLGLGVLACGSTGPGESCASSGATATVAATGSLTFSPSAVTVQRTQSVCWRNDGTTFHTVTVDQGSEFDNDLPGNSTFVHLFPVVGVFAYHCNLHPTMTGTITVQ